SDSSQLTLQLDELMASVAKVSLNGMDIGHIALPPYTMDLSQAIKKGENDLRVVVINSLRNLLDPLHYQTKPPIAGPELFSDPTNWQDGYNLAAQGVQDIRLLKSPK
ncbi:MAG: hypothetical protein GX316_00370, partial [Firmicutes bacterium]|nr:hypothetical protein [Bacillota bacterium]